MSDTCKVGQLYGLFSRDEAESCAQELTKETGKKHEVETVTENISDGLPARVMYTYYRIIAGKNQGS